MVSPADIEATLHRLYIGVPGTSLRKEDRKKTVELAGMLAEIERALGTIASRRTVQVVDAAAGKAYVGLLAAELLLAKSGRRANITLIERDPARAQACRLAAGAVRAPGVETDVRQADVAERTAWPQAPDLVVALHACGSAADTILRQSTACAARHLLLVPCCTSKHVDGAAIALAHATALGLPRHAEVRRRFIQAVVDGQRTLALEAAGYETEVVPFVPPTITPHNLLWRARHVGEARRMAAAARSLQRLSAF